MSCELSAGVMLYLAHNVSPIRAWPAAPQLVNEIFLCCMNKYLEEMKIDTTLSSRRSPLELGNNLLLYKFFPVSPLLEYICINHSHFCVKTIEYAVRDSGALESWKISNYVEIQCRRAHK